MCYNLTKGDDYCGFLSYVTLDNLQKIAALIIPIIATYLITRYSTNRPKKLLVKEKQFLNVYLPLYKFFCLNPTDEISRTQLIKYDIKLQSILHEHFELVFPTLHVLANTFHKTVKNEIGPYTLILKDIRYQIRKDYELLQHDLGYPAQNIFLTLQRMTTMDRLEYIEDHWNIVMFCLAILCMICMIIDMALDTHLISYAIIIFVVGLFIMPIMSVIILLIDIFTRNT